VEEAVDGGCGRGGDIINSETQDATQQTHHPIISAGPL